MTKLERAVAEAGSLPPELQEEIGEQLLHYIHRFLALRADLDVGLRQLDAGEGLDGDAVIAALKTHHGP